jgi:hypothetical protein
MMMMMCMLECEEIWGHALDSMAKIGWKAADLTERRRVDLFEAHKSSFL